MQRQTRRRHLPRLAREFYHGYAYVHWSMTIRDRKTGWLNDRFHFEFREVLLHTLGKYVLFCPIYVLMPDHLHILWMGMSPKSDQTQAVPFFRRHVNRLLKPIRLQDELYDSVLRDSDRQGGAFQAVAHYIYENPVRSGLVERAEDYPYSECLIPNYPELTIRDSDFWERFWRIHRTVLSRSEEE